MSTSVRSAAPRCRSRTSRRRSAITTARTAPRARCRRCSSPPCSEGVPWRVARTPRQGAAPPAPGSRDRRRGSFQREFHHGRGDGPGRRDAEGGGEHHARRADRRGVGQQTFGVIGGRLPAEAEGSDDCRLGAKQHGSEALDLSPEMNDREPRDSGGHGVPRRAFSAARTLFASYRPSPVHATTSSIRARELSLLDRRAI